MRSVGVDGAPLASEKRTGLLFNPRPGVRQGLAIHFRLLAMDITLGPSRSKAFCQSIILEQIVSVLLERGRGPIEHIRHGLRA